MLEPTTFRIGKGGVGPRQAGRRMGLGHHPLPTRTGWPHWLMVTDAALQAAAAGALDEHQRPYLMERAAGARATADDRVAHRTPCGPAQIGAATCRGR